MRKILTLGVSAMSLAALSAAGAGCTAGEEDDGGTGGPGGIVNVLITTSGAPAGGTVSIGNYAEFWSEVNETPQSQRDIPIGVCLPVAATATTSFMPTYIDVGDNVHAISGASSLTYVEDLSDGIVYYAGDVPGAPDDAQYAIDIDGAALGSVTVPAIPQPVTVTNRVVEWTTMGADDVYVVIVDGSTFEPHVCHTTDDGSFDFGAVLTTTTSGYAAVTGANYAEADLDGRTVTLIGQSGDPGIEIFDVPFGP